MNIIGGIALIFGICIMVYLEIYGIKCLEGERDYMNVVKGMLLTAICICSILFGLHIFNLSPVFLIFILIGVIFCNGLWYAIFKSKEKKFDKIVIILLFILAAAVVVFIVWYYYEFENISFHWSNIMGN